MGATQGFDSLPDCYPPDAGQSESKHMAKSKKRTLTAREELLLNRAKSRASLMEFLHRKPSDCGLDVAELVTHAKEQMKRPKPEKSEYAPPHTPDYIAPRHEFKVYPQARKIKLTKNCKRVKALEAGRIRKDWGKGGVSLINRHVRANQNNQKAKYDLQYAGN